VSIRAGEECRSPGIGVAHAYLHDVPSGHRRLEAGLEPYPRKALPGSDGDRHSAEHAAQRSLRSVEIPVSIDENHADAQGLCARTGMLEAAKHSENAVAIGKQPDGKVAAAALFGNQFGDVAAG